MVGFSTPQRRSDRYRSKQTFNSADSKSMNMSDSVSFLSPLTNEKGGRKGLSTRSPAIDSSFSVFTTSSTFRSQQVAKSSHIRVVARIRPVNDIETKKETKKCVFPIPNRSSPAPSPLRGARSRSPAPNRFNFNPGSPRSSSVRNRSPSNASVNSSMHDGTPRQRTLHIPKVPNTQDSPKSRSTNHTNYDTDTSMRTDHNYNSLKIGVSSKKTFEFDAVFGPNSSQKEVYERSVGDAVRRNVFRGFNTTILTFGQTGSGKTYTMSGKGTLTNETSRKSTADILSSMKTESDIDHDKIPPFPSNLDGNEGILIRAVNDLFKGRAAHSGSISIKLTYIEIYNDEIRDLLADPVPAELKTDLELRDYGEGGIDIKHLTKIEVKKPEHVIDLINIGSQRRVSGITSVNDTSSRSHAICTLHVTISPPSVNDATRSSKSTMKALISTETIYAKLTLVDLAGSERLKVAKTEGVQKKESISINTDLLVLGKVVLALAEKKQKETSRRQSNVHIPYRDSMLTRLLRDSLGGNCCTVMVACISPVVENLEESMNTLRYAMRTRTITNSVVRNVVKKKLTAAEALALRRENRNIRNQLVHAMERLKQLESRNKAASQNRDESGETDEIKELRAKLRTVQDELHETKSASNSSLDDTKVQSRLEFVLNALADLGINIDMSDTLNLTEEGLKDRILTQNPSSRLLFPSNEVRDEPDDDSQISSESFFSMLDIENETMTMDPTLGQDTAASKHFQNDQLEHEEFALQERVAGLTIEFNELNEKLVTHKKLDDHYNNEITEKLELRDFLMTEASEVGVEVENVKKIKAQISQASIEHTALLNSVEKLKEEEEALINSLDDIGREKTFVESQLEILREELETLQQQMKDLSAEKEELVSKLGEYRNIADMVQTLDNEKSLRDDFETQAIKLKDELKQITEEKESLAAMELQHKTDRESLEKKVETLTNERDLLVAEVDNYQNVAGVVSQLDEEREMSKRLEEQNKGLEIEVKNLEKQIKLEKNIENLKKQVGILAKERNLLVEEVENFQDATEILEQLNEEKVISERLSEENKSLQTELKKLREENSNIVNDKSDLLKRVKQIETVKESIEQNFRDEENRSVLSMSSRITTDEELASMDSNSIRLHASKLLNMAHEAMTKRENRDSSSRVSKSKCPLPKPVRKPKSTIGSCNITTCTCIASNFSGNSEHIQFFLPKLGKACKCGKDLSTDNMNEVDRHIDPTALSNILRPWQEEFLQSVGIETARQLVSARSSQSRQLAQAMIKWRSEKKMKPVKLKSCFVALHIWARTTKVILRSHRESLRKRTIFTDMPQATIPNFMEICLASDRSISTLGDATFGDMMEI